MVAEKKINLDEQKELTSKEKEAMLKMIMLNRFKIKLTH